MNNAQHVVVMQQISFNFTSDLSITDRLQELAEYLADNGRRYWLETMKLKELAQGISSLQALNISSFAALILEPDMYQGELVQGKIEKRFLCGPARIVNVALSFAGLDTKILYDKAEDRHVLVAFF